MSQMLKSSGAMAAATLTSRVLGMVREMVYAAFMGNTLGGQRLHPRLPGAQPLPPPAGRRRAHRGLHPHLQAEGGQRGGSGNVAFRQCRDFRAGHRRRGGDGAGGAGHLPRAGRRAVRGRDAADAAAVAPDVPLHAAGVPGGGVHRHGQRPRPLLRAGAGGGGAERGDDRQRAAAGPAHGPGAGAANLWPGHRRGGGGHRPGLLPVAEPLPRGLPLRVGFALAGPHRPRSRAQDAARLDWRRRLPDQRAGHPVLFVLVRPDHRRPLSTTRCG